MFSDPPIQFNKNRAQIVSWEWMTTIIDTTPGSFCGTMKRA